jgi:transcriptional regulator with XRE-family HTH domain
VFRHIAPVACAAMSQPSGAAPQPRPGRDGRTLPRRRASNVETKLADRRLRRGLTQKEMSQMTGIPLMTYRRLERGEIDNPPLRHLINCALVLEIDPNDLVEALIEDQWLRWLGLSPDAPEPPDPATYWRRTR